MAGTNPGWGWRCPTLRRYKLRPRLTNCSKFRGTPRGKGCDALSGRWRLLKCRDAPRFGIKLRFKACCRAIERQISRCAESCGRTGLLECIAAGLRDLQEAAQQAAYLPGTRLDRLRAFLRRHGETIMGDFDPCVIRTANRALSPQTRLRFRLLRQEIDDVLRAMIEQASADASAVVGYVRITASFCQRTEAAGSMVQANAH